jgi:hypothetical protein
MRISSALFLLLLLIMPRAAFHNQPGPLLLPAQGTIAGSIRDDNNKPIAGALVTAKFVSTGDVVSTLTDTKGQFELSLEVGRYEIQISAPEFQTKSFFVNIEEGKSATLDYRFSPADSLPGRSNKCRIEGVITDSKSGLGIPGAVVTVQELDSTGRHTHQVLTGRDGQYYISNISPGWTKFKVTASGYFSPKAQKFKLEEREVKPLDVQMTPKK